jgi:hypothetical protein
MCVQSRPYGVIMARLFVMGGTTAEFSAGKVSLSDYYANLRAQIRPSATRHRERYE